MITADTLARIPLFESAEEGALTTIVERSADVRVAAGDWAVLEGEAAAFYVVLKGKLEIVKVIGGAEHVVDVVERGGFFGEVPLLLGSGFLSSIRAIEPSRLMRLDAIEFHELVARCPDANRQILASMARRIIGLQHASIETPVATVTVIGHRWDFECYDLRDFLGRNHVGFRWIDPDHAGAANEANLPADLLHGGRYPVVVYPDGSHAVAPSYTELAQHLGLQTAPHETIYDVTIVGAGPAGLAAAVYGASEGLRTVLVESRAPGGQAGTSSRIENYLGFPAGIAGDDLSSRAFRQARRFGAEIVITRRAAKIEPRQAPSVTHAVLLDCGDRIETKAIVLAIGVTWRRLSVPGIDDLLGRGVYYGAARTEALGARGKDVFLVGGGNSAGQAAMLFSGYARSVTLLVRGDKLDSSMSYYLIDELRRKENVRIELQCEVTAVVGTSHLESIEVKYKGGERKNLRADALFVLIGAEAETAWLPSELIRDSLGFICTGRDVVDLLRSDGARTRDPYLLETSIPGIFAVGDVRHGSMKRVASSVGEGSMAIALVHQYISELSPTAIDSARNAG
ncbi:MAG: FAD-dependent oxidoreductase [Candidatus Eremiobacteraeota bacterium]|nr:FAD-dependent oxidoreductase [Candidatus Eremiobacteraeota bacterium]